MKKLPIAIALAFAFAAPAAFADGDKFRMNLIGYQEVPAVSTVATGQFEAEISRDEQFIDYELTYSGLQGNVTQSHIHFGQRSVNGGISIWLCQTSTNPAPAAVAATTPVCPQSGTVTGTISAVNVVGPGGAQQLGAGELAEIIAAIRAGVAYVNVHTSISPGGEIRGQFRGDRGHRHGHH
jgi:hypothetical protein